MARPKKSVDGSLVRKLAEIGCTMMDIAYVGGCSVDTLERRFADVIEKGRAQGRASLRRRQWELAMEGNGTMLVWLGKNLLGQKDRADVTSGEAALNAPTAVVRVYELPQNGRQQYPPEPGPDALPIATRGWRMRPRAFGELVKQGDRWHLVVSRPDPWRPGCYCWRDGQCYSAPEIIDREAELRLQYAPLPPEPDGLPRVGDYIVVRAQP